MPLPPGRFSITTGWPRYFAAISPKRRRCVAVDPPARQGPTRARGRAREAEDARRQIVSQFDRMAEKGRMQRADADKAVARLEVAGSLAALAGSHAVVEAIVESLDAKRALFAELEGVVGEDCLLASN